MNPITRTLRAYAADAREAFRTAPAEVALAVLVAATFSLQLRAGDAFPEERWTRVAAWAVLSLPVLLALTVLNLRGAVGRPLRIVASAVALLLAGIYASTLFHPDRSAEVWRLVCLTLAGVFFLLLTPAVPPRTAGRRAHWKFAFGLLARAAGVVAYAAVLYGALAGAVASVVSLFELPEPEHLYADMAAWLFLAAAPWILVGGVARLLEEADRRGGAAPLAVVRFGRFIYAPVVVVYLAILYAYALKVLATQELPKNLVSPLVLAAGLLGMAGALLLEPVHEDAGERGLSLLVRWVPALLLPLLPFALAAILVRQGQYGWTEFRYLRVAGTVLLGVVAVLGTVWLARRRMPPLASVPGILALGLLLVSIGPWSAQAVSRRDQQRRVRTALQEAGVATPLSLPGPQQAPRDTASVSEEHYQRIRDGVRYLAGAHGPAAAAAVIGPGALRYPNPWQLAEALPLRARCDSVAEWWFVARAPARVPVVLGGASVLVELDGVSARPLPTDSVRDIVIAAPPDRDGGRAQPDAPYRPVLEGAVLSVSGPGGQRAAADLTPLLRSLAPRPPEDCAARYGGAAALALPGIRVPLVGAADAPRGELLVTELRVRQSAAGDRIESLDGLLLLR